MDVIKSEDGFCPGCAWILHALPKEFDLCSSGWEKKNHTVMKW